MARPDLIMPTEGEDAEINRGIAADPDAEELASEWFASSRPTPEAVLEIVADHVRRRGAQKAPVKVPISVRLDADVVDAFKSGGSGWQTRINEALREYVTRRRTAQGHLRYDPGGL